ncbi:MAG: beta-ketoacyl synthase N-terminal-like domain-containing protein, partial [Thermodesulfobacteriota bacterium]
KAMITGIGWVNSAGVGQGRQAFFRPGSGEGRIKFSPKDIFFEPVPRYGRMDEYSRLGLAAIALALKDANLDQWMEMRNIAVIASTVYGCLQTDVEYYDTVRPEGGRLASPNLFAYTLPNTFLGEAAIHFGLTGADFIIHESFLSGLSGLRLAMNSMAGEECEAVITGICDASPPLGLGLTGRSVPGALFFVLQGESRGKDLSYGALTQNKRGTIFFNGKKVEDLYDLAGRCTKMYEKGFKDSRGQGFK